MKDNDASNLKFNTVIRKKDNIPYSKYSPVHFHVRKIIPFKKKKRRLSVK